MEWLVNLFSGSGVAHSVFIVALVIAGGLCLNKIKFGGVSLGVTWILFVGILAGHLGFVLDSVTSHFVKEFGLILFIYSIGLEVGPGFFSSFRKGGITLNMLAAGIVLLGCCVTYAIHLITGQDLISMIGVLSGAVTNTPGMGAAQHHYRPGLCRSLSVGCCGHYPLHHCAEAYIPCQLRQRAPNHDGAQQGECRIARGCYA